MAASDEPVAEQIAESIRCNEVDTSGPRASDRLARSERVAVLQVPEVDVLRAARRRHERPREDMRVTELPGRVLVEDVARHHIELAPHEAPRAHAAGADRRTARVVEQVRRAAQVEDVPVGFARSSSNLEGNGEPRGAQG